MRNRIIKITRLILAVIIMAMPAAFASVITFAGDLAEEGAITAAAEELDFSSGRLMMVAEDEEIIRSESEILARYKDAFLLQFDSEQEARNAYAYYSLKPAMVMPDVSFFICEGEDEGEEPAMTGKDNPLTRLEEIMEEEKTAGYDVALIDTGAPRGDNVCEAVTVIGGQTGDDNGHGTRMAGHISRQNPEVSIISIKALNADGRGSVSSVYAALEYAMSLGVRIINMSFSAGCGTGCEIITSLIDEATARHITVVGAAGNNSNNAANYIPGGVESALITGAADGNGERIFSSNYGKSVDYYVVAGSTSEAAAVMSGLLSAGSPEDIKSMLNKGLVFDSGYFPGQEVGIGQICEHGDFVISETASLTAKAEYTVYDSTWDFEHKTWVFNWYALDGVQGFCVQFGAVVSTDEDAYWMNARDTSDAAQSLVKVKYYLDKYGESVHGLDAVERAWIVQRYCWESGYNIASPSYGWRLNYNNGNADNLYSVVIGKALATAATGYVDIYVAGRGIQDIAIINYYVGKLRLSNTVVRGEGTIKIDKTVTGTDPGDSFTFTLKITDGSGNVQNTNYNYAGSKSGTISGNNGTLTLKGGQEVTVFGIPGGYKYTVSETENNKYVTTFSGAAGTIGRPSSAQEFTFTVTFGCGGTHYYTGSKSGSLKSGGKITLRSGQSVTFDMLPAGTTYMVEEAAVTRFTTVSTGGSGTIKNAKISKAEFINTYNPALKKASFTNTRAATVVLTKSSADTSATAGNSNYSLTGAKYTLYTNSSCTSVATDMSGNGAVLTVKSSGKTNTLTMAPGTYYVAETKASPGYKIDPAYKKAAPKKITLGPGQNLALESKEPPVIPNVAFAKVDSEENPVAGAILQIREGSAILHEWTSSEEESIKVFSLPLGTYTLHEVSAPGYIPADDLEFTVTANLNDEDRGIVIIRGEPHEQVTMVNIKMVQLPLTGGKGILRNLAGGFAMIMICVALTVSDFTVRKARNRRYPRQDRRKTAVKAIIFILIICLNPVAATAADADGNAELPEAVGAGKVAFPTLRKEIGEVGSDGNVNYGKEADSGFGKPVPYRLTGTFPSDYDEWKRYEYYFHDNYEEGLKINPSSVRVVIARLESEGGGAGGSEESGSEYAGYGFNQGRDVFEVISDITEDADIFHGEGILTVGFKNLKSVCPEYDFQNRIAVFYEAFITKKATAGKDSNDNCAFVEYSINPAGDETAGSVPDRCRLYTWKLRLIKRDKNSKTPLAGAGFTIRDENGLYLNKDMTLTDKKTDESVWMVNDEGQINVFAVDSGKYTLKETVIPEGYRGTRRFEVEVLAGREGGVTEIIVENSPLPETGDDTNMLVYIALIIVTAGVITGIIKSICNGKDDDRKVTDIGDLTREKYQNKKSREFGVEEEKTGYSKRWK
ncbi:MAG: SpaA isopeptide-forming pilin-related protein [Lachnospiraceae bacterium]|jgi:hypothetical protein